MKIKTILIAAMLAVSGLTQAQVSKNAFEKSVNFVNCKSIELSLKKSPTIGVATQFKSNCNCQESPDYNTINSAIPNTETKTIELSAEIDKVKTSEFKTTMEVEEVIKLLTEDIFANQTRYKRLFDFASKRKDDAAFASLKKELKKEIKVQLETPTQITKINHPETASEPEMGAPTLGDLEVRLTALEQRTEPKEEEKVWFDNFTSNIYIYSILTSFFITLIILFFVLKFIYNKKNEPSDEMKNYIKTKIKEVNFNGSSAGGNYNSNEINSLKAKINDLEKQIKILDNKIESNKIPFEVKQPISEPNYEENKSSETKAEVFFLSTPNSDSSFNESSVSSLYKEGASIYKFTKISNNRAKFEIDEREASIKLALQYPDKNIDPVCEAMNAFNPRSKRILSKEHGEVELIGDKWVINKKTKITYEN